MERLLIIAALLLLLAGCARGKDGESVKEGSYRQIDQDTAMQMMAADDGHVIVDVRRQDEYDAGHIPGAILLPNESIVDERPEALPDLNQTILIYCRSGNRSKQAAEKLVAMGYTSIYEFGGINTWQGEIVTGQTLTLRVESNPTTGFSWAAVQDQELFDVQTSYTADPQTAPVSGAGGRQTFVLTPKSSGEVRVTFTYSRPWEPSELDPQFTFAFAVSEERSITVTEDGSAQAYDQGYAVTVRID